MSVRNQHARQSKRYKIEIIDGVSYYFEPDAFVSKSVIYSTIKKIRDKKLHIPSSLLESNKTILVICKERGVCQLSLI